MIILLLAIVLDLILAEPPKHVHPTCWFGKLTQLADEKYRRRNPFLDFFAGFTASLAIIIFALILSTFQSIPWIGFLLAVYLTKTSFSIRSLEEHVRSTAVADIEVQRKRTAMLVSRDTSKLDRHELASASIESLSENLVDSIISPIFYFILFGLPGALIYRAINTMDAVIGYKDEKHFYFGKFAARLDDLLNFIPARITLFLFLPLGRRVLEYYRIAGFKINDKSIAFMSAVLGVKLEKRGTYSFPGRKPEIEDINRAIRVFRFVVAEWLLLSIFLAFSLQTLDFYHLKGFISYAFQAL
jgi:adenosylcobinamide-phosphate synthase